jgi:hypothetical protein
MWAYIASYPHLEGDKGITTKMQRDAVTQLEKDWPLGKGAAMAQAVFLEVRTIQKSTWARQKAKQVGREEETGEHCTGSGASESEEDGSFKGLREDIYCSGRRRRRCVGS